MKIRLEGSDEGNEIYDFAMQLISGESVFDENFRWMRKVN